MCLVDGGHAIVLRAFDNFKDVYKEQNRFETLMSYFRKDSNEADFNIDFMVSCLLVNLFYCLFFSHFFTHTHMIYIIMFI